ncbi:nucleotide exchange factor GrpE [Aliidiomarina shirensis]|uniref:Protein GrpE n=1 Tax=Aliidiomarina shirensis TaxID=1048642 RepID=A0A432WYU7_9GAMM|nr:nucleotide exchange factor GrpE [Aliidiomarina shirensis]RUO38861.1 nucleotide exchange factor GrpE [Aliidiomarina shirensis]
MSDKSQSEQQQQQETKVESAEEQVLDAAEQVEVPDEDFEAELDPESLQQEVTALRAEVQIEREKALRVAAEAENVRRRAAQEVEKARNFALEKFAGELLAVIDNLERALQTIDREDSAQANLAEGIEMTHKGFIQTIEKFGLEVVNPEGQPFNPQQHEAMGMQENADLPPNTVMHVMQKGYLLNGRLLRPAMVMVSRAAN